MVYCYNDVIVTGEQLVTQMASLSPPTTTTTTPVVSTSNTGIHSSYLFHVPLITELIYFLLFSVDNCPFHYYIAT